MLADDKQQVQQEDDKAKAVAAEEAKKKAEAAAAAKQKSDAAQQDKQAADAKAKAEAEAQKKQQQQAGKKEDAAAAEAKKKAEVKAKAEADAKNKQRQAAKTGGSAAAKAAVSKPKVEEVPKLSDQCLLLASVATPPVTSMKRQFDVNLAGAVVHNQLENLEGITGVPMVKRDKQGGVTAISLTGWTAMAGVAALVFVVVAGGIYGYRHYKGVDRQGYTLVMKQAPTDQ